MTRRRLVPWILGAALLAVVGVRLVLRARAGPEVETVTVQRAALAVTVDEEGRTRVRERVVVAAPVSGLLRSLPFHEGDRVHRGDVLARILPAPLDEAARPAAEARVRAAAAAARDAGARASEVTEGLAMARRTLARQEALFAAGAVASDPVEQARLAVTVRETALRSVEESRLRAEAELDAARAALRGQGASSAGTEVRAPSDGSVLRIPDRSARVVTAGQLLLELGDARLLEVVADVLTGEASTIAPGATVRLDGWGGDRELRGRVRLVEPSAFTHVSALGVEEQRVRVVIDVEDAPATLGDGYRVDVHIVTWRATDVATLPTTAVFPEAEGWAVLVVRDGVIERAPVRLGHRGDDRVELIGGLREGEIVVAEPGDDLRDGSRVRAIARRAPRGAP